MTEEAELIKMVFISCCLWVNLGISPMGFRSFKVFGVCHVMSLNLSLLKCCVNGVMSSANCSRIVLLGFIGSGISFTYKLNKIGDKAEPCGTLACDVIFSSVLDNVKEDNRPVRCRVCWVCLEILCLLV